MVAVASLTAPGVLEMVMPAYQCLCSNGETHLASWLRSRPQSHILLLYGRTTCKILAEPPSYLRQEVQQDEQTSARGRPQRYRSIFRLLRIAKIDPLCWWLPCADNQHGIVPDMRLTRTTTSATSFNSSSHSV